MDGSIQSTMNSLPSSPSEVLPERTDIAAPAIGEQSMKKEFVDDEGDRYSEDPDHDTESEMLTTLLVNRVLTLKADNQQLLRDAAEQAPYFGEYGSSVPQNLPASMLGYDSARLMLEQTTQSLDSRLEHIVNSLDKLTARIDDLETARGTAVKDPVSKIGATSGHAQKQKEESAGETGNALPSLVNCSEAISENIYASPLPAKDTIPTVVSTGTYLSL